MKIKQGIMDIKGIEFEVLSLEIDFKTDEVSMKYSCMGIEQESDLLGFKRFVAGVLREFGKI